MSIVTVTHSTYTTYDWRKLNGEARDGAAANGHVRFDDGVVRREAQDALYKYKRFLGYLKLNLTFFYISLYMNVYTLDM